MMPAHAFTKPPQQKPQTQALPRFYKTGHLRQSRTPCFMKTFKILKVPTLKQT